MSYHRNYYKKPVRFSAVKTRKSFWQSLKQMFKRSFLGTFLAITYVQFLTIL